MTLLSKKMFRWLTVLIVIGLSLCVYLSNDSSAPQNWEEAKTHYETSSQETESHYSGVKNEGKSNFQQRLERVSHEYEERQRLKEMNTESSR